MYQPPPAQLPILWGSFVTTHALFLGLTFLVPPAPLSDASWVPAIGLVAMAAASASVMAGLLGRLAANVQTWFILRFALAEAAAIVGFVAWYISGGRVVELACAAVGILAHLVAFPTAAALAQYEETRRA